MVAEGDVLREIHILTSSSRPAKQIVRDVETALRAQFGRAIDHRVVSVAYRRDGRPAVQGPVAEPVRRARSASDGARMRFAGVNLFVSGARTQAQVELTWKGLTRMGSASGWSTRQAAARLVAAATLQAVQHFLEEEVPLGVHEVEFVRLGRYRAAVISLILLDERRERLLTGTCAVDGDPQRAVVLATLAALNRLIGGLKSKEPIEYVLRPASAES